MSGIRHLFVLGMHRSGTSALCEGLIRLGLHGLENLQGESANRWNPRGYFEEPELRACNDALLDAAKVRWYAPPVAGLPDVDIPNALRLRMKALLGQALPSPNAHVYKDPRLCLTLPRWLPLSPGPGVVVIWRHPNSVARSLQKRDEMPMDVGRILWEIYMRLALRDTARVPRILVAHGKLLVDPSTVFEYLEAWLRDHGALREAGRVGEASAAIDASLADLTEDDSGLSESQQSLLEELRVGRLEVPAHPMSQVDAHALLDIYSATCAESPISLKRSIRRLEDKCASLELEARSYRHIMNKPIVRAWQAVKRLFGAGRAKPDPEKMK